MESSNGFFGCLWLFAETPSSPQPPDTTSSPFQFIEISTQQCFTCISITFGFWISIQSSICIPLAAQGCLLYVDFRPLQRRPNFSHLQSRECSQKSILPSIQPIMENPVWADHTSATFEDISKHQETLIFKRVSSKKQCLESQASAWKWKEICCKKYEEPPNSFTAHVLMGPNTTPSNSISHPCNDAPVYVYRRVGWTQQVRQRPKFLQPE